MELRRWRELNAHGVAKARVTCDVLCIPATDEADAVVALVLAQLLEQQDIACESLELSEANDLLQQAERLQPKVIFISALPPFAISSARALYAQLRVRIPHARIIVCFWHYVGDPVQLARRLRLSGQDAVVTTLSGALNHIARDNQESSARTETGPDNAVVAASRLLPLRLRSNRTPSAFAARPRNAPRSLCIASALKAMSLATRCGSATPRREPWMSPPSSPRPSRMTACWRSVRSRETNRAECGSVATNTRAYSGRASTSPNLGPTQEESLVRCEAIDCRRRGLAGEGLLERCMRDGEAAEVRDAFALD